MALIYAAIIPNEPQFAMELLQEDDHSATFQAVREVEGELYFMKPDLVIVLTEHMTEVPEMINTNMATAITPHWSENRAALRERNMTFASDIEMASKLKQGVDNTDTHVEMTLVANEEVEERIATPIALLFDHMKNTKVLVISGEDGSIDRLDAFGAFLQHEITKTNKRIAVVASGHLAASQDHDRTFDALVTRALREGDLSELNAITPQLAHNSGSDLYGPLHILKSTLDPVSVSSEVLSYEQLYNTGQLVAQFHLR